MCKYLEEAVAFETIAGIRAELMKSRDAETARF
jgi:hypothetical protein